jgi:hypothetical protein
MKQTELSFNHLRFNETIDRPKSFLPLLNNIVEAYAYLNILPLTGIGELLELIEDTCTFVVKRISNGNELKVGDIQIRMDKAFDFLNKPQGYDNLLAVIQQLNRLFPSYKKCFELVDNEVVLSEKYLQKTHFECSEHIETEAEQKVYDFATEIIKAGEKIFGTGNIPFGDIRNYFTCDPNTQKWFISGVNVKNNGYTNKERNRLSNEALQNNLDND